MPRQAHLPAEIHAEPGPLPEGHQQFLADESAAKGLIAQTLDNATALADKIGYEGTLSLGSIEDEIRFYQRRTIEGCLELGKRLLIMRELTPHGDFVQRVELLGISRRMANKFMASTLKFSNAPPGALLKATGNQSKLLELLVLDDCEIEALNQGESARGLNLRDIELMSRHELQAALKASNETAVARDTLVKNKQIRLDALEEENHKLKRRVETTTPDELALEIRKEADRIAFVAQHEVRANLYAAFSKLREHTEAHGGEHGEFMLGLIAQIELAADIVRGEFGLLKSRPDGDSTPYWERESAAVLVN